jgi:hypothetical protein
MAQLNSFAMRERGAFVAATNHFIVPAKMVGFTKGNLYYYMSLLFFTAQPKYL